MWETNVELIKKSSIQTLLCDIRLHAFIIKKPYTMYFYCFADVDAQADFSEGTWKCENFVAIS